MAAQEQSKTKFVMPVVHHNTDGWGPTPDNLPAQFVDARSRADTNETTPPPVLASARAEAGPLGDAATGRNE